MVKEKREYIVRKFILATSMRDAIRKEKDTAIDEIWRNQDYKSIETKEVKGFNK